MAMCWRRTCHQRNDSRALTPDGVRAPCDQDNQEAPVMADRHQMPTHHPRIFGTRHMVASANYLAAQTGFEILEAGGNAIDAGVAAGLALGVLQCEYGAF